jgi:uncharacterized protein (DUF427 family)
MPIKILFKNKTVANTEKQNLTEADGKYYFDKKDVEMKALRMAERKYFCPIKNSTCDYYDLTDDRTGEVLQTQIAWIYEQIPNSNFKNIEGKVAFDISGKGLVLEGE